MSRIVEPRGGEVVGYAVLLGCPYEEQECRSIEEARGLVELNKDRHACLALRVCDWTGRVKIFAGPGVVPRVPVGTQLYRGTCDQCCAGGWFETGSEAEHFETNHCARSF